jgi:hypothetical protein
LLAIVGLVLEAIHARDPYLEWMLSDAIIIWLVPVCRVALLGTLALSVGLVVGTYGKKRPVAVLVGLGAMVFCFVLNLSMDRVAAGPPRVRDGVIMQSTGATCVAATGANIACRLGVTVTEAEMIDRMGTTVRGTSVAQAIRGMAELGLGNHRVTADRLQDVHPPAMLYEAYQPHVVALMGWKDGKAEIWDPSRGKRLLTPELVDKFWAHHAMEFYRIKP